VRIRTRDGGSRDLLVPEWVHHPSADVAAAPFIADGYDDLHLKHVPAVAIGQQFVIPDWRPDLGDRVYFLGLLSLPAARGLTERNVPMVRSGTIGAMYQADMPHRWPDKTIRRFEAHLIDCRSYKGFSGSPCFYQRDNKFTGVHEGVVETGPVTNLLGLVSGHLDTEGSEETGNEDATSGVLVNTGVGLIAPAERIREVLLMVEFADERKRIERDRKAKEGEEGATLDAIANESEFDRFEDLTRKLVNTPKPEKDEES
jgi:hypothetical protein